MGLKEDFPESSIRYMRYIGRKRTIILLLVFLLIAMIVYAVNAGSVSLNPYRVLETILGWGDAASRVVIWNIRLPRILAGIIAGAGLSAAGCVMQNNMRNPLASPFTLGISHAAAFGASMAIIVFGAGTIQGTTGTDTVIINSPSLVTVLAFAWSMAATAIIMLLAGFRGVSPEAIVLAGVALGSLFTAGTTIIQYFSTDIRVAAVVFWTFGDLGRASWREVLIMAGLISLAMAYFIFRRWDYNAQAGGEESAKGLGVEVERVRLEGMFISSLVTAVAVSFLGIIGFIDLVAPHMMRILVGSDHRFLIPASAVAGALLLLAADTLARTVIAPVVLPVGAITSFLGAPIFLYMLSKSYRRR